MLHRVLSLTHAEPKYDPNQLQATSRCGLKVHVHMDTRIGSQVEVSEASQGDESSDIPCPKCTLSVGDYVEVTDLEGDHYQGKILAEGLEGFYQVDIGSLDFWKCNRIRLLQRLELPPITKDAQ